MFRPALVKNYLCSRNIRFQLNIDHNRQFALVAQASNRAHLIDIDTSDPRTLGRTIQDFSLRDAENYPGRPTNAFGAVFANRGECIIFGSVGGTVLVWDKRSGKITHELDHECGKQCDRCNYFHDADEFI